MGNGGVGGQCGGGGRTNNVAFFAMPDASGVEALPGETEAEYVARQARLREEAAERMRQKFGGSGGLSGGMRMGGLGSQPNAGGSGSNLLSSVGSGLSSVAGIGAGVAGLGIGLLSAAGGKAKDAVHSARESVQGKASFDMADISHLPKRSGVEGSTDLSDLLGSTLDEGPPPVKEVSAKAPPARAAAFDDAWDEDSWDAPTKPSSVPQPVVPAAATAERAGLALEASQPAPSVHYSGGGGGTGGTGRVRKVAAVKAKGDDKSWDDFGDTW
jgi:hypothetical protein